MGRNGETVGTTVLLGYAGAMTHPAEAARKHIMEGLEACQADPALESTLEALAQHLARAQGKLFPAIKLPADSPGAIDMMRRSMDHLAQALKVLQDLKTESPVVGVAASAIAKALQALHPVVQDALKAAKVSVPPPAAGAVGNEMAAVDVHTMLGMNTDHQFYLGFSENIEQGGIFVATFEPRAIGEKVLVNFKLPGGRAVTAQGEVQWVRVYNQLTPDVAPGMGVKFINLMPSDRKAIESFIKTRAPMFYED